MSLSLQSFGAKGMLLLALFFLLSSAEGLAEKKKRRSPASPPEAELGPGIPQLDAKQMNNGDVDADRIDDVDLAAAWERERKTRWTNPGTSATTPTGFGADWGIFYAGLGIANRREQGRIADSSLAAGFGLGDSFKYVGLDIGIVFTDVDHLLEDVNFSIKLHRYLGKGFGIALGTINDLKVGEDTFETPSRYLVVSKILTLKSSEMEFLSAIGLHLGAGTGQFRSNSDFVANRQTVGPFGGIGARLWAPLSVAANWSGSDINVGLNLAPFRSFRFVFALGITDVLRLTGRPNTMLFSLAWGDSLFEPTFPSFLGVKR